MIHLYPYLRKKAALLISFGLLSSTVILAQTPVCGPIVEDFNNTGGTMAGFSSSTLLSPAPGFVYGATGQNGYLQKCDIAANGSVYQIITPTYQSLASQTTVGYGFELTGAVVASNVNVYLQFFDADNNITTVAVNSFAPVYTGTGSNSISTICYSFAIANYVGFTPGERYRFIFEITASSTSNNNQCMVFDNFRTTGTNALAPLPVSFIAFSARKAGTDVQVIWNVAGEKEVLRYEVERSNDGRNFVKIGEVAATGASGYAFTDPQPVTGVSFYRVRNVDLDGKYQYSKVIRINTSRVIGIRAFPQPARTEVTIEHGALKSKGWISLSSASGQVVKRVDVPADETQTLIDISQLKAGIYLLRFDNGLGQVETLKLVKQ